MNDSRFDDIARRFARAGAVRGSRRGLLKAGAVTGVATALPAADLRAAAPFGDSRRTLSARSQAGLDQTLIQQIAFDLDYDPDKIFRFVADEIAYESYNGALRGVRGTIWSGAGNSVDQSQLLAALLNEAAVDLRFAEGTLGDADAETLLRAMSAPRVASPVLERAQGLTRSVEATAEPAATPLADQPEPAMVADRIDALRDELFAEASAALDQDVALLAGLLSDAGIAIPEPALALAELESSRHVWLQIRRGADWTDLDPSFAGADVGRTPATLTGTMSALPDDLFHTVTVRVVADTLAGDAIAETAMLDFTSRAQDLVGQDLILAHLEPEALAGLGASITQAIDGRLTTYPLLMHGADGELADSMLTFATGGGVLGADVLGGGTGIVDGECLAERYEVTVASPGAAAVTAARILFDRVPPAQRASGTIVPADIPMVEEVDLGNGEVGLLETNQVVAMAVVGSVVDPSYLGLPLAEADTVSSFTGAIHGLHALREALDAARTDDPTTYLDRPNVTAYSVRPVLPASGDDTAVRLDADLLHQSYGFRDAATAGHGIYAGVLAQKAERLALDQRLFDELLDLGAIPTRPVRPVADVQTVFAAAGATSIPIIVVTPDDDAALSGLGAGEAVEARLRADLASGRVVVIPAGPVTVDGIETTAWWAFDPTTGAIVDRLADGRSGASVVFSPMTDYIVKVRAFLHANKGWLALGACIAAIARAAASIIGTDASARTVLNVGGNIGGALATCGAAAAAGA